MKRNAKVDLNQKELVKQIRALGGYVLHTHQLKNAFDILVGYRGKTYIIEIKNNEKGKLSEGEQKCKDGFNSVGVEYHVIWSIEQFIEISKIN
jgi:Holliday junction resolvase